MDEYQRGLENGKKEAATEASFKGIALTLDFMREDHEEWKKHNSDQHKDLYNKIWGLWRFIIGLTAIASIVAGIFNQFKGGFT